MQYLKLIKQIKVKSSIHLKAFLKIVLNQKGEGVVVRNPWLNYQTGRLKSALKVKLFSDQECIVIAIIVEVNLNIK